MKNFIRIVKYLHIPKGKLSLYVLFTLLSTLFSMLSFGLLAPFLELIFTPGKSSLKTNAIGPLKIYFQNIIITHDKMYGIAILCIVIIIATVIKNIFLFLSFYISTPVRNSILANLRLRLYTKILQLPVSFFSEQRKGDIMNRMTGDVGEVNNSVVMTLEGFIKDPIAILGYLCYLIYISPKLSLFLLLLLPITGIIIGRVSKTLKRQSTSYSREAGSNLSHVEESLGGMKVIKAFTAEDRMMGKFKTGNNTMFSIANKMMIRRDLASPLTETLGVIVLAVILYIGGTMVLSSGNTLVASDLLTYIMLFAMIINPAKSLSTNISNIQKGIGAIDRIEEILHAPVMVEEVPDAIPLKGFERTIEFKNVSFAYNDTPVLQNISLTIPKGKTIALVGSSGSGKSTMVDLVPRFHDVVEGEILIDGVNLKKYQIKSLRRQMSFVTQEPILFNDTIANNIALGNPDATIEDITNAARIANAHNFISQKEEGYDTNIGDRGMKLSGGERQRITIARAVLNNPPILILDEATSSLDTESERLVQDAIDNLMQNRTSIVIAHRLSTIRNADEIIVLQNGQIIERGTHESLIAREGSFYKKLVEMQEIK
jgi:subfamily B ATP-binding cassette protein MsbA